MLDLLERLYKVSEKKDMARAEELSSTINRTETMFTSDGTGTPAERERNTIAFLNSIQAELDAPYKRSVLLAKAVKQNPNLQVSLDDYMGN